MKLPKIFFDKFFTAPIFIFWAIIIDLLTNPNPDSPAQREAFDVYMNNPGEYKRRVKEQARINVET